MAGRQIIHNTINKIISAYFYVTVFIHLHIEYDSQCCRHRHMFIIGTTLQLQKNSTIYASCINEILKYCFKEFYTTSLDKNFEKR